MTESVSQFINYDKLPEHMREGTRLYIEHGLEPGGFLYAVLTNSLTESFSKADYINLANMKVWVEWLYMECPSIAWRTPEKVDAWIERGGFKGK